VSVLCVGPTFSDNKPCMSSVFRKSLVYSLPLTIILQSGDAVPSIP
jgi:hypothetical protein